MYLSLACTRRWQQQETVRDARLDLAGGFSVALCNRCRRDSVPAVLRRVTAPADGEELVKRVGKKLNGRYALVSIFSARSKIRLVVCLLPFAHALLLQLALTSCP